MVKKQPLCYTHGTYNCFMGPWRCRCDLCRQAMDEYWAARGYARKGPVEVECVVCGIQFEARTHNAKCCSFPCRQEHRRQQQQVNRKKSTCRRCCCKYAVADEPYGITQRLCPSCCLEVQQDLGRCQLCGVAWWNLDGTSFCSDECQQLDAMRQAIIDEDYV